MALAVMACITWSFHARIEFAGSMGIEGAASSFGGCDWVTWVDTEEGVVAERIHPLIKGNPLLYDGYFHEGDILRRIEYQDVYRAEMVRHASRATSPGSVVLYWVERPGTTQPGGGWRSLLIEHSFRPSFSFIEQPFLWSLSAWLLLAGNFIALITILIILPIIRRAIKESWPILLVVLMAFLLFLAMGLHHINLLVSNSYSSPELEQVFTFLLCCLLPLYGAVTMLARLQSRMRWMVLLPLGVVAVSLVKIQMLVFGDAYFLYSDIVQEFVLCVFLTQVMAMLLLSIFQMWKGRSRLDKTFHILALAYTLPLLVLYALQPLDGMPRTNEWTDFLSYGTIFIPLINAAAAQLKFGRVSLVLTTTLQYVVLSSLVLLLYYLLHLSLDSFGLQIKYQAYLELALVIVLVFGLRAVYKQYEPAVRRYFVLAQQSRRDKIERFIASISQYTSSGKLLEDLVQALKEYFNVVDVGIHIRGDHDAGKLIELEDNQFKYIYDYLRSNKILWARNRQITQHRFPDDFERWMQPLSFSLATEITVNEQIYGLIMLGRKRSGVFNIDDQELLQRIVQQTRLTLGVLHLLEREKLLIQKNYEANLTALRSQINPHFLFNTLNTISALIRDEPDEAEKAVDKLAFIFRYTLKNSDKATVTLREELSLVRTYLEIEKIRFGERLQLNFEIDDALLDLSLPAFVIQTIVENCIKHGIAKIIGKGMVSIKVMGEDEHVRCEIEDNGPGIDHARIHASTGLSNTHTRMSQIYGRDDLLHFENTGHGTRVTVLLPR